VGHRHAIAALQVEVVQGADRPLELGMQIIAAANSRR
jgi:hypothetical protein